MTNVEEGIKIGENSKIIIQLENKELKEEECKIEFNEKSQTKKIHFPFFPPEFLSSERIPKKDKGAFSCQYIPKKTNISEQKK